MKQSQSNKLELRAIPDLLNNNYFIPEYQRGYRWESNQVIHLLNDLIKYFEDDSNESFYCLQSIVVKKCDEDTVEQNELDTSNGDWYEVIDGQQRLTTIRILCSIFDALQGKIGRHKFTIKYATRSDMDEIYQKLKTKWDEESGTNYFVKGEEKCSNLDSVYIYHAAETIVKWFNEKDNRESIFGSYFFNDDNSKKSVRVIWYEDFGVKDSRDLFNEINEMKVSLSCSELIRSLFLSSTTAYKPSMSFDGLPQDVQKGLEENDKKNQQRYINTKWDEIEHRMSDRRLQSFVTNIERKGLRNNIEILFDLISQKTRDNEKKDPLYTFIYFLSEIKEDARALWGRVEECYSRICSWMENREFYHKIGYLNALSSNDSVICDLLKYSAEKKRYEFEQELDRRIKESVKNNKKLSDLSYDNKDDYDYIRRLLFLYNIELNRRMKISDFFAFEQFKPLKGHWTLEHINAQNSDKLPNKEDVWREWAKNNAKTLDTVRCDAVEESNRNSLITKLQDVENKIKSKVIKYRDILELFDKVYEFYGRLTSTSTKSVHQLTNMTLLSQEVNSAIGCSVFEVKRQNIIDLRNRGSYFPIGTLNVFQKAYNKNTSMIEWGYKDRRSYLASLKWVLKSYISNFD